MMGSKIAQIIPPEDLDFFLAEFGGSPVLTKQDKFVPVDGLKVHFESDTDQKLLEVYDLYVKHKGKNVHKEFEEELKGKFRSNVRDEHPYKRSVPVEVILIILMPRERHITVDVDNLTKSVLDCLTGIVIEDDSQVINVFAKKRQAYTNGFLIGVRRLDIRTSWFRDIHLLTMFEDGKEVGRF